jgi:hypothetical protein
VLRKWEFLGGADAAILKFKITRHEHSIHEVYFVGRAVDLVGSLKSATALVQENIEFLEAVKHLEELLHSEFMQQEPPRMP